MATRTDNNENATKSAEGGRSFGLQRIYLKDVSFESPLAPAVFQGEWKPTLNVNIGTRARALEGDLHEIVLTVTVEAKQDDKVAFLVELQQAGIFLISGFSAEERQQVAAILCPQNLFPFAREEIASLTVKGGFPQILLQPINFERIYQQGNQPSKGKA
ncbi:MAG TPA: protein-export chaperone SecB [Gammaproteobacteria bacterium]